MEPIRALSSTISALLLCGSVLAASACTTHDPDPGSPQPPGVDGRQRPGQPIGGDHAEDFVSDVVGESAGGETADAGSPASDDADDERAADGGAERAIAEADILQLKGDRLYALSRYSGLSVIDMSDPTAPRLEGSYRSSAEPFEMYVLDGVVLAMFNAFERYVCEDEACSWQQTSRLEAIDATDPADIRLIGEYDVPGSISDSRLVGDVLYLATHENGYCWRCDAKPNTSITSFNVADVTKPSLVDQLRFAGEEDTYYGRRSITVTTERIYVSGRDWRWGSDRDLGGEIQVVDITDPDGALVAGAKLAVAGRIQSRWQMDEYQGVLRVISQPGGWRTSAAPKLETFRVDSASEVHKLATLELVLPRPESLRSVRFDGERGYAITFEQIDPLFTFDLRDPAAPKQVGELEIPGWVYHMEPRGDRVLALGFDNGNDGGSLNVSLFDVSDLAAPTMIDREHFGGDWGSFAEDQDRIHKAFSILPEHGLILVPFAGSSHDPETCRYEYASGIQLIDYDPAQDALTARGVAPQHGNARRALIHRGYLVGVGDNAVQTFDISDRDRPVEAGKLEVARNVDTVRVVADQLLRFGSDWWTGQTTLELTSLSRAGEVVPDADIDLSALFGENAWTCNGSSHWGGQVFTHQGYAYVPRYTYDYGRGDRSYERRLTFYVIRLSGDDGPEPLGTLEVPPVTDGSYFAGIVQTDKALLVGRSTGNRYYGYYDRPEEEAPRFFYDVVDLRVPEAPVLATRFEVPASIASRGWGYTPVGCGIDYGWGWDWGWGTASGALVDGDIVASQHSEPVDDDSGRVRYFLDRIDVSDPGAPRVLEKVNIPGELIRFSAARGELVTVDTQAEVKDVPPEQCDGQGFRPRYFGRWDDPDRTYRCVAYRRSLNLLVLQGDRAVRTSQLQLDRTRQSRRIAVSDSRIFYTTAPWPEGSADYRAETQMQALRVEDGRFVLLPPVSVTAPSAWWWANLRARGERAFVTSGSSLYVVDTTDPHAPSDKRFDIPGWGCRDLEVADDTAYCALGRRGVEVIDLSAPGD